MDLVSVTWYMQAIDETGAVVNSEKLTEHEAARFNRELFEMRGIFNDIESVRLPDEMRAALERSLTSGLLTSEALGLICSLDPKLVEAAAEGARIRLNLEQAERLTDILWGIEQNSPRKPR